MKASRVDTAPATFAHAGRTPVGGLRVSCNMTSCGVFEYEWPDGRTMRELRHPDEVFAAASIASIIGAPVTDLHPAEFVTPANHAQLQKGHVFDAIANGIYVAGHVDVNDAGEIALMKSGERVEISMGYNADVREESGVWEGQVYDAIQSGIVYNHCAFGPQDWGRHGSSVALRTDTRKDRTAYMAIEATPTNTAPPKLHKIGKVPYHAGSAEHCDAVDAAIKDASDLATSETKRADTEKARADKAETELAAFKADAKKRADAAERTKIGDFARYVEKKIGKQVESHISGRPVFDKKKDLDPGMSNEEILKSAIKMMKPGIDVEGIGPEGLAGIFTFLSREMNPNASEEAAPTDEPPAGVPDGSALPTGDTRGGMRGKVDAKDVETPVSAEDLVAERGRKLDAGWRKKRA